MDLEDNFELNDEDIENIDKDIEDDEHSASQGNMHFNKTVKGGLSN